MPRHPSRLVTTVRHISARARMYLLGAAVAGAVFALFGLVGVGGATSPLAGPSGARESIHHATYEGAANVAVGADTDSAEIASKHSGVSAGSAAARSRRAPRGSPLEEPQFPSPPALPREPAAGPAGGPLGGASSPEPSPLPALETPVTLELPAPVTPQLPLTVEPSLPPLPPLPEVLEPIALPELPPVRLP